MTANSDQDGPLLWEGKGWGSPVRHAIRENTGVYQKALCGAVTEPQMNEFDPKHFRACKRCIRIMTPTPSVEANIAIPDVTDNFETRGQK